MHAGTAIRELRLSLNLKQQVLAQRSGISTTALSAIELGAKQASTKTIEKICKALNLPEPVLYLLAIEITDIHQSRRRGFAYVHAAIFQLVLQAIMNDELLH